MCNEMIKDKTGSFQYENCRFLPKRQDHMHLRIKAKIEVYRHQAGVSDARPHCIKLFASRSIQTEKSRVRQSGFWTFGFGVNYGYNLWRQFDKTPVK